MLHIVSKIIEIKMFISPLFAKTWLGCFEGYLFCDLCVSGIPAHPMEAGLRAECLSVLNSSPSGSRSLLQGMSPDHSFQKSPEMTFLYAMLSQHRELSYHERLVVSLVVCLH